MTRDHHFVLDGPAGLLEALSTTPVSEPRQATAVICHPHPLHQGTMHNKVVYTLSRAYHHLGLHTVRFNYRGVGQSEGGFGDYEGEIQDCRAVIEWVQHQRPEDALFLAGFSFGAYIAAANAARLQCQHLISVAPAVHHRDYTQIEQDIVCPWLVIQGTADQVVPFNEVLQWQAHFQQNHHPAHFSFIEMSDADHFFHGRLIELRQIVESALQSIVV